MFSEEERTWRRRGTDVCVLGECPYGDRDRKPDQCRDTETPANTQNFL